MSTFLVYLFVFANVMAITHPYLLSDDNSGACYDSILHDCGTLNNSSCKQLREFVVHSCPVTCKMCDCYDELNTSICADFMARNFCSIAGAACRRTCKICVDDFNPDAYLKGFLSTIPTSTTVKDMTTTAAPVTTTLAPLQTHSCNKYGIILELAKTNTVTHPMAHVCPNTHEHGDSDAVLYQYCQAPNRSIWTFNTKVVDNCDRIPPFTAILGTEPFNTLAAVFIQCEAGGFKIAAQRCGEPMKIVHVTMSTTDYPAADKYYILDWPAQ
ncbi:uncharacterized protein LOC128242773 [Mya arenaria]|uniref:uncharacterized protein LOC128242773 n=1 Tax=Mya arenaria TaxID=6604 RepID=UPI0022E1E2C3|nr:uncharacterized protein LOC128242773 [Mya arenaria]